MQAIARWAVLCIALSIFGGAALVHAGTPMREEKAGMLAQAKVTPLAARATARARVNGDITDEEIEREHGKLVYSFDIKVAGKAGIEEVLVDAVAGTVIAVEHESAKDEAAEAAREAKAKARLEK